MRNLLFVGISALLLHLLISAAVIQYQWFPGRKTISIGLFIAGALVAGEALALLVGMHLPVGIHHPWLSLKNYSFLILDIAIGSAILAAAFRKQDELLSGWLLLLAGAALLLHLYREWEHLSGLPNRFWRKSAAVHRQHNQAPGFAVYRFPDRRLYRGEAVYKPSR